MTYYHLTFHYTLGARHYFADTLEEALDVAKRVKSKYPCLKVTLKREGRDFKYWLGLIIGGAPIA
jgi:hypothetical protein